MLLLLLWHLSSFWTLKLNQMLLPNKVALERNIRYWLIIFSQEMRIVELFRKIVHSFVSVLPILLRVHILTSPKPTEQLQYNGFLKAYLLETIS